jgi:hypothetical protein
MTYTFYYTGPINPNFRLDVSGFDMSQVVQAEHMLHRCGYESKVLNTSLILSIVIVS